MRRFDKIKNIQKANLLAEQRYLQSKVLINENELSNGSPDLNDVDYIKDLLNTYLPHNVGEAFPYGEGDYTFSDGLDEIIFTGELLHEDASIYNYDLGKFTKKVIYKFKFTYEIIIQSYPRPGLPSRDYNEEPDYGDDGEISLKLKEAFIMTEPGKIIDVKKYVMDKSLKPLERSIDNIFWDEYIKKHNDDGPDGEPDDYDDRPNYDHPGYDY